MYHSAREGGADVLADADPELRREVEKLLAQYASGGKIPDWPVSGNILIGNVLAG